jgi:hypothetical protein
VKYGSLTQVLEDVKYLKTSGFTSARIRSVFAEIPVSDNPRIASTTMSQYLWEAHEKMTDWTKYFHFIRQVIFIEKSDFIDRFFYLISNGDSFAHLQFHLETALVDTPGLDRNFFPLVTAQLSSKGDLGDTNDMWSLIRIRISPNSHLDFQSMKRINKIHKCIFRVRSILFRINRIWSRADDPQVRTLRTVFAKKLQVIIHSIIFDIIGFEWKKCENDGFGIKARIDQYREFLGMVEQRVVGICEENATLFNSCYRFLSLTRPYRLKEIVEILQSVNSRL